MPKWRKHSCDPDWEGMIPRDQDLHQLNTEPGKESLAFQKLKELRKSNISDLKAIKESDYLIAKSLAHKIDAEIMQIDDPNHGTEN